MPKQQHPDDLPPQTFKIEDARKDKLLADNAVQLSGVAARGLFAAEQLGIKTKPLENFSLAPPQRAVLLIAPGVSKELEDKLRKEQAPLTVAEVASLIMTLADASIEAKGEAQIAFLILAKQLTLDLGDGIE